MKTYSGKLRDRRAGGGQVIWVNDDERILVAYRLPHIARHSPDGFNWGYGGSGPADVALSILTDCLGALQATELYQQFKSIFVAGWNEEFSIDEQSIKNWAKTEARYRRRWGK